MSKIIVGENAGSYTLTIEFSIWRNKESRDNGDMSIASKYMTVVSDTAITTNVYEVAYNMIKEEAETFVDDDDV